MVITGYNWFCLVLTGSVAGPLVLAPEEQQGPGGLPDADRPVLEGPAAAHRRRLREVGREVRLLQRFVRQRRLLRRYTDIYRYIVKYLYIDIDM